MPGERIVIDGLRRCLCPSIDSLTRTRTSGILYSTRQNLGVPLRDKGSNPGPSRQRRSLSTAKKSFQTANSKNAAKNNKSGTLHKYPVSTIPSSLQSRVDYILRVAKSCAWLPGALFEGILGERFKKEVHGYSKEILYAALQTLHTIEGSYWPIIEIVQYLVKERGEKPNAILYEHLVRANVDRHNGSAGAAAKLLEEMEQLKIPIRPQTYRAILEVTSVHPDYVLRSEALFHMKNCRLSLTSQDNSHLIVGLLRDKQYELALDRLEQMNEDPNKLPLWLLEIFLYTFGELGFHDETLAILRHRARLGHKTGEQVSLNVPHFLLDTFSRDDHYPGVKYLWDRWVTIGRLNPSDGTTENVIATAARHGDAGLVVSAIENLSARGQKLGSHHYEALLDVHIRQGEFSKAFAILCIMAKAGLSPDLSSTRSIFRLLRHSPEDTQHALEILYDLRLRYSVPAAAFNVVLEATNIHLGFKVALDLYRSIRQICEAGPDIETYQLLLSHCSIRKSMNFLVAEMESFGIEHTADTYNQLIRICTLQDDYEQAFKYLELMTASGRRDVSSRWWLSKDTALALVRRCIQARDSRAPAIIDECRSREIDIDREVKDLIDSVERDRFRNDLDARKPKSKVTAEQRVTWDQENVQVPVSEATAVA